MARGKRKARRPGCTEEAPHVDAGLQKKRLTLFDGVSRGLWCPIRDPLRSGWDRYARARLSDGGGYYKARARLCRRPGLCCFFRRCAPARPIRVLVVHQSVVGVVSGRGKLTPPFILLPSLRG